MRRLLGRVLPSPAGWLPVAALGVAVAAGGCGGSDSASASAPRASAAASSNSARAVLDPQVLAGYNAQKRAYEAAVHIPDPDYPALAETEIDPLLSRLHDNLGALKQMGIIGTNGEHQRNDPRVVSVEGATAIVLDCVSDPGVLTYKASGQPVPDQPGGPVSSPDLLEGLRVSLKQVSPGRRKVSDVEVHVGSCPSGY